MATEAPLIMSPSYQPHNRPNSLLIPPNPAFAPGSPRGGILMNRVASPMSASTSVSGLWPGTYTPRSPSPLSASLSPDSAPADRNLSIGSRKIRFAPLPEPRRDVMVDEDGTETPCSATYPADATAFPASPSGGTSVALDRTDSLMTDSGASTASTEADTQSQISRKKEKRNSILRIFGMKGSSTPKRTSTSSLPTDGISGLGLSLFRPSSRESWSGEMSGYTSDNSVSRRMSSPLRSEFTSRTPNYGSFGAPLMHAASDGSGSVQRPQRMLNGRVYGAKRAKERIQPQPSMEPEFSEWGYGGMGSVGSSGEYGKLQSNSSSVGGGDDDDDGSGMTWIRKRKEKREREEREKKAAEEAAAAEAKKAAEGTESSAEPRASTETSHSTPTIHAELVEAPADPKTPTRETYSPVPMSPSATQPPSRTNSNPLSPPRTPATRNLANPPSRQDSTATVTSERHVPTVISVPAHRGRQDGTVLGSGVAMSPETSPERSSSSSSQPSSDDEENGEDSSSTTGRDEDEDEEEENQKRKTALSAGIEKISRHHA
ncbi:hypothetical protein FRC07_002398 [Ceratobasidium sp. 392]|nr:hypothetical protein FRC07_002398 [Ceratobasidium sp. 392]